MELRVPHVLHLFNILHENDGSENCAQLIEEECNKCFIGKAVLTANIPGNGAKKEFDVYYTTFFL